MNTPETQQQPAPAVASSAWLGVRPWTISEDNLKRNQRRQWMRNKQRLRLLIGNILTLGLGENLWYGDRLDRKVDVIRPKRMMGNDDVNVEHAIGPSALANQVPNPRHEVKRNGRAKVWVFGRYKLTIECLHIGVMMTPNDQAEERRE